MSVLTIGCEAKLEVPIERTNGGYLMVERTCGRSYGGQQLLCDPCEDRARSNYPQGWQYRPGDTCRHGVYVGGCGVDYMCGACEMGDDES